MRSKITRFILGSLLLLIFTTNVFAVTIDNDGKERKVPYGDSKLASCYSDSSYVDCYIPYKLTPKDIGGYAVGATEADRVVTEGGGSAMPESLINSPVATTVVKESYYQWGIDNGWLCVRWANPNGFPVTAEEGTGLEVVTDKNGSKYYMTAVQPFFFNHDKRGSDGFPKDDSEGSGEIIDVILTDGTCIHFVCFDINAAQHTNGVNKSGEAAFDYIYDNCKLKMEQYNNLFSTQNANTLEIWGRPNNITTAFKEKYNLGSGEGQNRIAYYRMYNKFLKDSPKRANGVGKEVSFSYGNVTISSSSEDDSSFYGGSLVPEDELDGMTKKTLLKNSQGTVDLPSSEELSAGEGAKVAEIRDTVSINRKVLFFRNLRTVVVFIGLLLLLYSVFLVVAYIFDRVNMFFDLNLLSLVTFGRLRCIRESELETGKVSFRRFLKVWLVVFVVGVILVSGGTVPFIMKWMYKLKEMIVDII